MFLQVMIAEGALTEAPSVSLHMYTALAYYFVAYYSVPYTMN
jgi:hypothetical protein